jgi:hypothetical protein
MSLSTLRTTYGRGARRDVINRAIRAEFPGGNAVLDGLAALHARKRGLIAADQPVPDSLETQIARRQFHRDQMAAQIEAKHNVGPDLNRRAKVADGAL